MSFDGVTFVCSLWNINLQNILHIHFPLIFFIQFFFILSSTLSAFNRSVVFHIRQFMSLIFKKQQHSASSLNFCSQSKCRETEAFERFSELERSLLSEIWAWDHYWETRPRTASYLISRTGCAAHQGNTTILRENTFG